MRPILSSFSAYAFIVYVLAVFFPQSGNSQTGENYINTAMGWENYYNQHPELTNPPSHEYKNYLRWRGFWDQRSQSMDTSLSGKPSLISAVVNQIFRGH